MFVLSRKRPENEKLHNLQGDFKKRYIITFKNPNSSL